MSPYNGVIPHVCLHSRRYLTQSDREICQSVFSSGPVILFENFFGSKHDFISQLNESCSGCVLIEIAIHMYAYDTLAMLGLVYSKQ